jgi:hypothetical protein
MPAKDPDAEVVYGEDWADYLAQIGAEAILVDSQWVEDTGDLTLEDPSLKETGETAVRVGGGSLGKRYTVTNRVTISSDRGQETDDRSMVIPIREM